jgi:hypothetical protein
MTGVTMDLKTFLLEAARIFVGNAWKRTGSTLAILGGTALTGWLDQLVAHWFGFKLEQTAMWVGLVVMLVGGYPEQSYSTESARRCTHKAITGARYR